MPFSIFPSFISMDDTTRTRQCSPFLQATRSLASTESRVQRQSGQYRGAPPAPLCHCEVWCICYNFADFFPPSHKSHWGLENSLNVSEEKTTDAKTIPEAGWGDKKTTSPVEWRPQTSEQVSAMGNRARGDRQRKVNGSQAQHAGRQSWTDSDKCWTWAKYGGSWWWGELEKLIEARTCNFFPLGPYSQSSFTDWYSYPISLRIWK